ncbi:MAG: glycosyltransferase family 2 protein [Woeseiaceae bacterium]
MTNETSPARLYIVITDFNGWDQTKVCLHRLQASSCQEFSVIVVDHGTTDETANGLTEFPSCIRISADSDLWWTGAINKGIRKAMELGATRVMLLNNDCYVNHSTVSRVLQHLSDEQKQVVAPLQRNLDAKILVARTGTCFTLGFPTFVLPYMKRIPNPKGGLVATEMIVGGRGVVIPAEVFDAVGLFDEDALPHYGADHDFYMRCRAQGIPLFVASNASVEIDDTRSTVARDLGAMNWNQFRQSLQNPRSHRNITMLTTLFKRHYPIKSLYLVGVALNLARYFGSYLGARSAYFLTK